MDPNENVWLLTAIKRWQRDQSVEQVLNIDISSMSIEGECFQSEPLRISLEVILESGEITTKRFIVKKTSSSDFARMWNRKYRLFRNEVQVYTEVLQKMENLMTRHGDKRGRMWSRMYGHFNYDSLIFEDLNAKGYEMMDRRAMMNLEESNLVIASLARFHAMGMVLIERGVVKENDLGTSHIIGEAVKVPFMLQPLEGLSESIRDYWSTEWLSISKKIDSIKNEASQLLDEIYNPDKSVINVILHGDFRTSNLLMKRNYVGRPAKCKILDFQLTTYGNFTIDLHYFMTVCIKPDIRRDNYDEIIAMYHLNLAKTLKFYDYPSAKTPTLGQVNDELKRTSLLGFLRIFAAAEFSLGTTEKFNIVTRFSRDRGAKMYDPELFRSEKFKEWFGQDIYNFVEKGCFC